jgi:hypothetical protein
MEGPTSSGGSRNRLTCLTLQEHDDDDESRNKRLHISIAMPLITRLIAIIK